MGSSLGKLFTVTCFGESHGTCIGVVIDGCPAGLPIARDDIQGEVDKRKPGCGTFATTRKEDDSVEILSGIFDGFTTGAPVCLLLWNKDADSEPYNLTRDLLRPGHADYTARMKYGGFNDFRGGGHFSGRITAGFIMAGAVAKLLLKRIGIEILAYTIEIGGIKAQPKSYTEMKENAAGNLLHCADPAAAKKMLEIIARAAKAGDSVGGIVEGIAVNMPAGLGEPVFDTLEGELAKALFAVPAVKGVEFGAGFAAAGMKGSENNDPFIVNNGKIETLTNNAGGILGGISDGGLLVVRVAVKPTPSIAKSQQTVDIVRLQPANIEIQGRHDTCIVPRVVPVVEAMMAVTLCDLGLRGGIIPRVIR